MKNIQRHFVLHRPVFVVPLNEDVAIDRLLNDGANELPGSDAIPHGKSHVRSVKPAAYSSLEIGQK